MSANIAIRLYRRLFGTPAGLGPKDTGIHTLLDGNSAVAVTEACIAENAALTSAFPANGADLAWQSEQTRQQHNVFGELLGTHPVESPRGAIAAACGLAMAGQRATTFLSTPDLTAALDLLNSAATKQLPLVLHASNRALGGSAGTCHQALHQICDAGFFVLFACNVQQAVDFTLIARRVAEETLTPGLVIVDQDETAAAIQNVHLLSPGLIQRYLGRADEQIECTSTAEKMLYGETRRRLPQRHNLDRPVLQEPLMDRRSHGLGRAAHASFFGGHINAALQDACDTFAEQTGRSQQLITTLNTEKAKQLIIVQGAATETLLALSSHLKKHDKQRIGIVGIHALRPLPSAELLNLLQGKTSVTVLERAETTLAGDPPLLRELRMALGQALENGRFGEETHPGLPALRESDLPRLRPVIYGLGGLALNSADLVALINQGETKGRYLGIDFTRTNENHPKRQVLLDALRRDYPEINDLGICAKTTARDLRPDASLSFAVQRLSGAGDLGLAAETASFIYQLVEGEARIRCGESWNTWGEWLTDRVVMAPEGLRDCGSEMTLDLILLDGPLNHPQLIPARQLPRGGCLLMAADEAGSESPLSPVLRQAIQSRGLKCYRMPSTSGMDETTRRETCLGALCSVLIAEEKLPLQPRKLISAHEQQLQQGILTEAFITGLEQTTATDLSPETGSQSEVAAPRPTPMAVRHLAGSDDSYDSLPRFWDQTGILYRDGDLDSLTPDPYLASGLVPPLSATFKDHSGSRTLLPVFDPQTCTACGDCWSACPDGAIGVTALSPTTLINAGIGLAGASALRPLAAKLGGRISALGRQNATQGGNAADLIREAFDWLQEKAPLAEDRRSTAESGIQDLEKLYGALPLAVTEPLFQAGEQTKKDGGELLALAINPDACKACGLCIAACQPQSLSIAPQTPELLQQSHQIWAAWEVTPDTASETIERVAAHPDVTPMAAQLLSRYSLLSLASGDSAESGSGEKIALRLTLATIEYRQQPLLHRFAGEVGQLKQRLNDAIKETLVDALPTEDLERLAGRLAELDSRQIDINELTRQPEGSLENSGVDADHLRRLTTLAQQLSEQHWRLTEGQQGLGRARYGLALAPGVMATWAASFPHNPFQVPVALDSSGETAQLAAGLLEGQIEEALTSVRLVRKAKIELGEGGRNAIDPGLLSWQDLTDEEKALCPPLLLVGNEETLGGRNFSQIAWLLNSGLPIKVLTLTELDFGLDNRGLEDAPLQRLSDPKGNLGLLALSQRNAYVAQTSIADPAHLRESVSAALACQGPALLRVHTPSPARHGFATDRTLEQARLAVRSRAFPLFQYDPRGEGVFGSRLNLAGNPARGTLLHNSNDQQVITLAHWALTEDRFASRFRPLADDDAAPTALQDWLALDVASRAKKTPIISVLRNEESAEVCRVDPQLGQVVVEQLDAWRTLQELAGIVTPFTARVELAAEARVAAEHETEINALRAEYETQLNASRKGAEEEIAGHIRERLMVLAGYK
ncbi:MAG: 4Fe-4S binding protein [gamma proteobacterium endosymbiont of Lamellibrachia anaximandri]|nr:4Fe-4S binding protein [gamma proteobacterium endosymbiont of Lamellibrachia anaximandri]MBL3532214.1 4Fe-4S binding protein [gamma proteobacterium endosymbiont of Lamellibrachia anaximandri]